ncbi:hypothetical protein DFH08DRAFT_115975 [Mycena albidolilacea]|uniref:Uncharacterized protein n=1 Tax=Mycena albidolilacea TaxID=1033008 RepID=A0AAD7A7J8_9AGAR|nr:hypothetical protein DFH08DRAFT_115975 [Mycena albidolilacea]
MRMDTAISHCVLSTPPAMLRPAGSLYSVFVYRHGRPRAASPPRPFPFRRPRTTLLPSHPDTRATRFCGALLGCGDSSRYRFLLPLRRSTPPSPLVIMAAPPPLAANPPPVRGCVAATFVSAQTLQYGTPRTTFCSHAHSASLPYPHGFVLAAPLCVTLPLLRIRRSALPPRMISLFVACYLPRPQAAQRLAHRTSLSASSLTAPSPSPGGSSASHPRWCPFFRTSGTLPMNSGIPAPRTDKYTLRA